MKPLDLTRQTAEWVLAAAFLLLTAMPLVDFLGRPLAGFHIPGSGTYTQQLTFYLTFLGGLFATWTGKHLKLSTAVLLPEGVARHYAEFFANCVAAAVTAVLTYASVVVVLAEREQGQVLLSGVPIWVSESVMPLALGLMTLSYLFKSSSGYCRYAGGVVAVGAVFALGLISPVDSIAWLLGVLLMAATLVGSPVFAAMSGLGLILFWRESTPVSAVTAEIFRLIASPTLPVIPLLTATGYVLAATRAPHRLVGFFRALFGFMPGGVAVLVGAVCALFTAFTGGSGITIIALGGLV